MLGAGHLWINFFENVYVQLPFCIVMLPPTLCLCSCILMAWKVSSTNPDFFFLRRGAAPLLRTNSSHSMFNKNMQSFKTRLKNRGYPNEFLEKHLFEVNFKDRKRSLENKHNSTKKKILPFVTQYHPALPNLKNILMGKWHLIQNQTHLKEIFQEPPILSYRKGKSLKDILVRAKL